MCTEIALMALFSSWRLFTLSLYVSNSHLRTLFCCWRLSIRFCIWSRETGDGGAMMEMLAALETCGGVANGRKYVLSTKIKRN